MKFMKLSTLLEDLDSAEISGSTDIEIEGIAYDSRKSGKNYLFAALSGVNFDGHTFIPAAVKLGAKAIICNHIPDEWSDSDDITFIKTENTRRALASVSHIFYGRPTEKLNVIGITGTNGKTTTTYLIKSILDNAGKRTAIIGTTGIIIENEKLPTTHTTPESLELCRLFADLVERGISHVVMEVSSHALAQERVYGIDFDSAIFTNITPDHLDYHNDMFEYATAKKRLFDMLKPKASAIIFDNSEFSEYIARDCKAKTYFLGRNEENDFVLANETMELAHSSFTLKAKGINPQTEIQIETSLSGKFNIDNAALAAAYGLTTGIDSETIKSALSQSNGAPGRMQAIGLKTGALALVDYAHTPDALEKALIACREIIDGNKRNGRLICLFGCGGDRDKTKRPVMGKIASTIADYVIITSDNPRTEEPDKIIEQIYGGIEKEAKSKVIVLSSRSEAIKYAVGFAKENDLLLVAGKGDENYQVIGTEKVHFNDVEEIGKYNQ